MEELILVVGAPRLKQIRTKYRRFYLYESLKTCFSGKVLWATSTINTHEVGIYDDEVVFHHHSWLGGFNCRATKRSRKLARELMKTYKVCKVVYTLHRYPFVLSLFEDSHVNYDCSDNWVFGKSGLKGMIQSRAERKILKASSKVIYSSNFLLRKHSSSHRKESVILSPGIRRQAISVKHTRKSGVMVGHLCLKKYSSNVLNNALGNYKIDLFGSIDPDLRLELEPNNLSALSVFGFVEKDELFTRLTEYNFAILPYNETEFTSGIYPLKIYELINANCLILFSGSISVDENPELGLFKVQEFHDLDLNDMLRQRVEDRVEHYLAQHDIKAYEKRVAKFLEV